jgi:hypothetical protein
VTRRREYLVLYRQRLSAKELRYVRTMHPVSIDEVTPGGWTRTLLAPKKPKANREESCCKG